MRRLTVFNFATLNGFFKGPGEDIRWHRHGGEEHEYSVESLKHGGTLLFGRITYEMMAGYWPSPMALSTDPIVAEGMNKAEKIVFSKTLKKAQWKPTTIIKGNIIEEVRKLKKSKGKDMAVLGSGSILTQFAENDLIDEYQIMIDPVLLGSGTPMFRGLKDKIDLKLTKSKVFKSGVVLLCYEPLKQK
jgi:dihydrofolate reductase